MIAMNEIFLLFRSATHFSLSYCSDIQVLEQRLWEIIHLRALRFKTRYFMDLERMVGIEMNRYECVNRRPGHMVLKMFEAS